MKIPWSIFIIMLILSIFLHYPHFNKDLVGKHVWRQTQTQSNIDNFYKEDPNILNPRRNERGNSNGIFRMEFPLMQWLIAGTYKITGPGILVTRIWIFIIGLFTVAAMFGLLNAIFKNQILAVMGSWAFNWSPAFFYYTINPLPDMFALCFSIWGMALFFSWTHNKKNRHLLWSGILLGLGTLCKLPFILYYIVPAIYFITELKRSGPGKNLIRQSILLFSFSLFPVAWYATVISGWQGNGIVRGLSENKTPWSTLARYLLNNTISVLPELLLNYAAVPFFILAFYFLIKRKVFADKRMFSFVIWGSLVLVYFLYELNMIKDVHDYYLFPFYPMLFILTGYGAYHFYTHGKFGKFFTIVLLCLMPVTAWLRNKNSWNAGNPGFNKDLLVYKKELRSAVPGNALCLAGNDFTHYVFFYYLDKKGWIFDSDNWDEHKMRNVIKNGAEYLYSDSRKIDENPVFAIFFDTLVLAKGSFRVYKLKN